MDLSGAIGKPCGRPMNETSDEEVPFAISTCIRHAWVDAHCLPALKFSSRKKARGF